MTNVPVPQRLLFVASIWQTLGKSLLAASFSCQDFLLKLMDSSQWIRVSGKGSVKRLFQRGAIKNVR
jgi:hypothetical protein